MQPTPEIQAGLYWVQLENKYPSLDVYEQYELAKKKYGGHPPRSYFEKWLEYSSNDILPQPPSVKWQPPVYERFLAYCESRGYSVGFARHTYAVLVAGGWKYFGEKVNSDEQWQAICDTMEWNP